MRTICTMTGRQLCWVVCAAALAPLAARAEGGTAPGPRLEERPVFDPGAEEAWNTAESTVKLSVDPSPAARPTLRWCVRIDHGAGERNHPVGWPRFNRPIPPGPARDWSAWDFLRLRVRAQSSCEALPRPAAGLVLHTPDKANSFHRDLVELRKDEQVEILIPTREIPRCADVRLVQIYLSEANYRHGDTLELELDPIALVRYAEPTLAGFAPENAVLYADAKSVPVRFELLGVAPGERANVVCELVRGRERLACTQLAAGRGLHRLTIPLPPGGLAPGECRLRASVAGARAAQADASIQLVESPWR